MQYAVALLAFVATVSAQTATGTPPSCSTDFPGLFVIETVNVTKSTPTKSDTACTSIPLITLKGGVMTDQNLRQAEIVANHQFQFDNPLQIPRFFDAGFSVCQNNSLAIGSHAIFWQCASGEINNIYDESLGGQCYEITIQVHPCSSVDLPSSIPVSVAGTTAGVGGAGAATLASSAPSTSATVSATSAATSASSARSTSAATSAISVARTTAAITSSLAGPAIPSVAPFPKGNSTTPAGTASATAPGGRATTSALTAPASGASATIVGSTFGLVAAALVAFAML